MYHFFIGHNGYSSCLKCATEGEYNHEYKVMTFPELNAQLRTDEDFRLGKYEGHHKKRTCLETIPGLDMIKDFPIGDPLHIIDLGVTKKFLQGWKIGNLNNFDAKWSAQDINNINSYLKSCKVPQEIHRSVRGLEELAFWKGTEYRTFLFYLSLIIVERFFDCKTIFDHFLHYYCAITICSRKDQTKNLNVARNLLNDFLEGVKKIYGQQLFTSNMHNLSHIVDDVERLGPLSTFSAYPFENRLSSSKRLVRSGNLPLSQVATRICELQSNITLNCSTYAEKTVELKNLVKNVDSIENLLVLCDTDKNEIYSSITLKEYTINSLLPVDKWILMKNLQVVSVICIIKNKISGKISIFGAPVKTLEDYFVKPVRSSQLQIFLSNMELSNEQFYNLDDVYCKMVKLNYNENSNESILIPLIHTTN